MTTKFVWNELKKLVVIDHNINKLKQQIKKEQEALVTIQTPLSSLKARKSELECSLHELQKKIDSLELSLAQLRQTDAEKKALLETLSHPKEYHALEKELADIERHIFGFESQELKLMEEQEAAQKELASVKEKHAEIELTFVDCSTKSQNDIAKIEQEIQEQEAAWKTQAAHIPPDLSRGYTEIRQRVPNPVVPIVSSSCSACFYGLLHQDTIALTNQTVIRCRGCYRFLFTPDSSTEQLAS